MAVRIARAVGFAILFFIAASISSVIIIELVIKPWAPSQFFREPRIGLSIALLVAYFVSAGIGFRFGFRERPSDAHSTPIRHTLTALRGESSVIHWLYSVLFVLPTSFLFLVCLGGAGNDHDRIGSGALIVYFPPLVNIFIMAISLAATPLVSRYSKGWASAHHLRNSIAFPIASVLIAWLGAAIGG